LLRGSVGDSGWLESPADQTRNLKRVGEYHGTDRNGGRLQDSVSGEPRGNRADAARADLRPGGCQQGMGQVLRRGAEDHRSGAPGARASVQDPQRSHRRLERARSQRAADLRLLGQQDRRHQADPIHAGSGSQGGKGLRGGCSRASRSTSQALPVLNV
jgi:hypothetical protein